MLRIASAFSALALLSAAADAQRAAPRSSEPGEIAVLRGLDKITARTRDFQAPIGETVRYGGLDVTVRYCRKRPPEEPPEIFAFIEIRAEGGLADAAAAREADSEGEGENAPPEITEDRALIFSGWMFASNPALSALEHPVYDVWVIDCIN